MNRYFLVTVKGLPRGNHPEAPAGIPAEAKIEIVEIPTGEYTGQAGFCPECGVADLDSLTGVTFTHFAQLENTLTDLV